MLGLQLNLPLSERWYLPVQASAAYTSYLGCPGCMPRSLQGSACRPWWRVASACSGLAS